jgi:hypothetical protein
MISFIKGLSKDVETYFPEIAGPVYLINAPKFISRMWYLAKRFLDPAVEAKISIHSGIPSKLAQDLGMEAVPIEFGGSNPIVLPHVEKLDARNEKDPTQMTGAVMPEDMVEQVARHQQRESLGGRDSAGGWGGDDDDGGDGGDGAGVGDSGGGGDGGASEGGGETKGDDVGDSGGGRSTVGAGARQVRVAKREAGGQGEAKKIGRGSPSVLEAAAASGGGRGGRSGGNLEGGGGGRGGGGGVTGTRNFIFILAEGRRRVIVSDEFTYGGVAGGGEGGASTIRIVGAGKGGAGGDGTKSGLVGLLRG